MFFQEAARGSSPFTMSQHDAPRFVVARERATGSIEKAHRSVSRQASIIVSGCGV